MRLQCAPSLTSLHTGTHMLTPMLMPTVLVSFLVNEMFSTNPPISKDNLHLMGPCKLEESGSCDCAMNSIHGFVVVFHTEMQCFALAVC